MIKKVVYTLFVTSIFSILVKPVFAFDKIELNGKQFTYHLSSNGIHSFIPADQKDNPYWKEKISFIYASNVKNEK